MRATWRQMRWFERTLVTFGVVIILTNGIAAFLPPRELWRLLVSAAWSITVSYIFLVVSYRGLVDEAQALTRSSQDLSAKLLAELQQRDEPWRLS